MVIAFPCCDALTHSPSHHRIQRSSSRWQHAAPRNRGQVRVECQALSTGISPSSNAQQRKQRTDASISRPIVATPSAPRADKVGVLLLNLGGPDRLEDVQPFLYNLFADPDIIRLPAALKGLQPALATLISTLRAPKSAEGYRAIGGGSPLRRITEEQAAALTAALHRKGMNDIDCYVAMRYWSPFTEDALEAVVQDGVTRLVILPLYPQFSISTSGSSLRLLEQLFKQDPVLQQLKHTVIPSWYQRQGYVEAMANLILAELEQFPDPVGSWDHWNGEAIGRWDVSGRREGFSNRQSVAMCWRHACCMNSLSGTQQHAALFWCEGVGLLNHTAALVRLPPLLRNRVLQRFSFLLMACQRAMSLRLVTHTRRRWRTVLH
jgi:hypothetical protein